MIWSALVVVGLLFGFLATGTWIFVALIAAGAISLELFRGIPVDKLLAPNLVGTPSSPTLLVLPLFILMAEILFRSRLSQMLFEGLTPISSRLPGRLLHANVLGCTLFAATCGSSAATTMTIGRVTYDELVSRGYSKRLVMGTLAGPGALGLLIPPSTVLIVYGVLTETSILRLFLAGFVPGILLAILFSAYVVFAGLSRPEAVPNDGRTHTLSEILAGAIKISPVVGLVLLIMGSMYLGVASPTETAAFGVFGAMLISLLQGTLTLRGLWEALHATVLTTSMLGLIIAAAGFLSTAFAFLGIPQTVAGTLAPLVERPYLLILFLVIIYIILGCFLEGISMLVMTLPVVFPIVLAAGFDPIWFGIFLVMMIEIAQITPPLGFNIFVIQKLTGEELKEILISIVPFFIIMCLFVFLMTIFPQIATFGS